jgi:hypothetical protein
MAVCVSADRNDGLDGCSEGGKQTLMTTVDAPDPPSHSRR